MNKPTASAHALVGFSELVQSVGVNPLPLLRGAHIARAALTDSGIRIPLDGLAKLLDDAAEATGWPDFALRLAKTRRLSHYGAGGLLARDEPDVRHALLAIISNMRLKSENVVLDLQETGAEVAVTARLAVLPSSSSPQSDDLIVGGLFQVMKQLLGDTWQPMRVGFAHSMQQRAHLYRRYFGCPVLLGQDTNVIVLRPADLEHVLPDADPALRSEARQQLQAREAWLRQPLEAKVIELIKAMLPTGHCSMERVALRLGVQTRTLHRQLSARGVTFSQLTDDTRRKLAMRYVMQSGRPITQIAQLLGFSETSAFSRWFSRTFQRNASALRAERLKRR
ncbi:AraC family transcriptional regulator [Burkholderia sp. IMCC1007]|uniref:AraC family transcriptional regulator n=1 Tax=Burkholderia sp. IMCC1007 TaxID=3004104 RepID=UPI0022B33D72|nr:AraC family transcriptional regulator [Burkholderia sp. IMCC1007]